jgi:hypothetical protein
VETWLYWTATGDYPWPNSFRDGVASEIEELTHLDGAYKAWKAKLDA